MAAEPYAELVELNPKALTADGFEEAYLGYVENRWVKGFAPIAVYSRRKCIAILAQRGMSYEEAHEYFEFNVAGAYVGPNTPMFLVDREVD